MRFRALLCAVTTAGLVLGSAATAWAHVTVHTDDSTPGDYAKLTFRVPTERDDASTTKLSVTIPAATPFASVSTQPHPGWSVHTTTARLEKPLKTSHAQVRDVVRRVTWTANSPAAAIEPGQFDEFSLSVGPLPKVASVTLPAVQTYSNGDVVRWIETAAPGAPEPQHPAPHFDLTTPSPAAAPPDSGSASDTTALVLAVVALVLSAGTSAAVVVRWRRA